jgi:hypothetical protein
VCHAEPALLVSQVREDKEDTTVSHIVVRIVCSTFRLNFVCCPLVTFFWLFFSSIVLYIRQWVPEHVG